jgi:predicted nucleotidyltransferase
MSNHGLTEEQINLIQSIMSPYRERIDRVSIFGSRATGNYRPNSDLDLVVYGTIDQPSIDRLWTLFDESMLPIKVDLHAYHLISYPPLKEHIDQVAVPLF